MIRGEMLSGTGEDVRQSKRERTRVEMWGEKEGTRNRRSEYNEPCSFKG